MITLVFSYSHADEELRNELEKHLTPLKRNGKISTWHDRRINPGQEFESQIEKYFSEANIILLLISSDFIASDYCYQVEMKNALQRHKNGEAVIIPVILRECAWHNLPFGHILAATIDGKPITKFGSLDEGFVQVVNAVTCAIDNIRAKKPQQSMKNDPLVSAFSSSQVINTVRSSNLSLPKSFSDLDRDHTCREGFKYVSRYFENSLSELRLRNLGVEYDFQPDGDAFRCTIYINGRQAGRCGIWRNGNRSYGMGDICYSQDGITRNSYNESFIVTDNGQILGFRALMGGFSGTLKESLLTNEGMAEHLWDMFFNPIKQRAG